MASSTTELLQRNKAFLLLRYTLIAATAYLILVEGEFSTPPLGVVLAITAALLSNVLASLVPARMASSSGFGLAVIVADTAWITAALVASGRFNAEFFYLYFFVLLLAAIGENLSLIAVGSVVVCCAYLYALSVTGSGWSLWRSPTVIRIPFLFTVEARRIELETTAFTPRAVVEETVELLAGPAQRKGVEVAYRVGPAVPRALRGDPGRLRQVLLNLVGNALKFTAHGEVAVRVGVVDQTAKTVTLRFEVADTGIGIGREKQACIFEPFAQANRSTTREYGGTGLGLAIAKQLVGLRGGEIGLQSEPGRGSRFWFTVRLLREPSPAEEPAPRPDLRGLRVLVIDDNDTSRAFLEEQLRAWGLGSDGASDGRSALPRLRAALEAGEPYALVLLDADMPGLSGRQLVHAIHAAPALSRTPLVLLTAIGEKDPHPPGVVATLTKPVREARLAECLARVAGRLSPRVTPLVSAGSSARRLPRAAGS